MNKLKLYIWTVFSPDYTGGLAFAIAATEEEAKELVINERGYRVYDWGDLEVRDLSRYAHSIEGGS